MADDLPTEGQIVEHVAAQGNGISALEVMRFFVERGYDRRNVQRAVQRALDRGSLQLGPKLHLVATQQLVAA